MKKLNWENIFKGVALLEALTLLVISFAYWNKIDQLNSTIDNQNKKLEQFRKEIIELKITEENYQADLEHIYECYHVGE